jgi:hypothetical protein
MFLSIPYCTFNLLLLLGGWGRFEPDWAVDHDHGSLPENHLRGAKAAGVWSPGGIGSHPHK